MKPMIKVRMLRTTLGAPDSVTVREYKEGQEYSIPEDLAECFFSTGDADPAEAHENNGTGSLPMLVVEGAIKARALSRLDGPWGIQLDPMPGRVEIDAYRGEASRGVTVTQGGTPSVEAIPALAASKKPAKSKKSGSNKGSSK